MEEGWKQYRLIDILDTLIDYRGKTPRKTTSGIPLITAKIIKNGRIEKPTEFIAIEDYDSWMVRGFPKVGDVVLTTEAPLGEVAQLDNEHVALAQRVVTLRELYQAHRKGKGEKKLNELSLAQIIKVPLTRPIHLLLDQFKKMRKHVAVIIDEF